MPVYVNRGRVLIALFGVALLGWAGLANALEVRLGQWRAA